jgi:AraC-like DNA-binding protein
MLTSADLVSRPDFTISTVTCRTDHTGWSPPEVREHYLVVLVRRGQFRRHVSGTTTELDPTMGYLCLPNQEQRFAHPTGGDVCTAVRLSPPLWRSLAGETAGPIAPTVYVDAHLEWAHRRLHAVARGTDIDFAVPEQLMTLLAGTVQRAVAAPTPARTRSGRGDRIHVAAARAALAADHPASHGLLSLARLVGMSPYRLSRAFTRELGVSVTHYRNRVRVSRALQRLETGEDSLARLAADLGFADQAHLCRTMRQHLGQPPTALRRLLARP